MLADFKKNIIEKSSFIKGQSIKQIGENDHKMKYFGSGNYQLTKEDIIYIVYGACFLGSGGGGSIGLARLFIEKMINENDIMYYVNLDNLEANKNIALVAVLGAPNKMFDGFGDSAALNAFLEMDNYLTQFGREPLSYLMPVEMGAINVLIPFIVSARKGVAVINGDPSGRAVPKMSMNLLNINKLPLSPVILTSDTDEFGDYQQITVQVEEANDAESQAREFARSNNNITGIACYPMQGSDLNYSMLSGKKSVTFIQETVGIAWHLGRNIVESGNYNEFLGFLDMISLPSYTLFEGIITDKEEREISGFDVGKVIVTNRNEKFFIYYKNESLLAWNATRKCYAAMGPDSINFLARKNAQPFTNADINSDSKRNHKDIPLGTEVGIIGLGAYGKMQDTIIVNLFLSNIREILEAFPEDQIPIPNDFIPLPNLMSHYNR